MGSTISYTDLRENLEKGVCQTPQTRYPCQAKQPKPLVPTELGYQGQKAKQPTKKKQAASPAAKGR